MSSHAGRRRTPEAEGAGAGAARNAARVAAGGKARGRPPSATAKTPEEQLTALRQREADAHARLQRAEQEPLGAHGDIRDRVTQNERLRSAANRATAARTREEARQRQGRAGAKTPAETIHERAARLQREGHLPPEVQPREPLVPVARISGWHDPLGPLDAHFLQRLYGDRQLGRALQGYSLGKLREAATGAGVTREEMRTAGLKASSRADLATAITAHMSGGVYSANFGARGGSRSTTNSAGPPTRNVLGQRAATLGSQIGRANRAGDTARRDRLIDDLEGVIKQYRALGAGG